MTMSAGTRIGAYEVIGPLGAGGMGEVYRARDVRLGREVAVKVLPLALATDSDRIARLRREAQVLATLNHPNIAQLHELEETESISALIMELVEGTTLADRIEAGAVPLDEALTIAKQIALALEAAHAHGIVHRDLKPANIKVRADGTVKVLDFGLAKATMGATASSDAAISPTLSLQATQAGMILGTAAYMAPEQARGKPADARADVWGFGVVLFEMLTGRRAFDGAEVSDTLASVLKSNPEWSALPHGTPPPIRRLLRRCLAKDPAQRLQHIGDARLEIDEAFREDAGAPVHAANATRGRLPLWTIAAALMGALVGAAIVGRLFAPVSAPEMRLELAIAAGGMQFAIAPDGLQIAYSATGPRGRQVWIRRFDSTTPRAVPGTDGGEYPFWSPDSKSLGFFARNALRVVSVDGGDVKVLTNVVTPAGGTWNRDGIILFVPSDAGGVYRIAASGGDVTEVTPRASSRLATRGPHFLPDGKRFLFYVARGGEAAGVYVGELGVDRIQRVVAAEGPASFALEHLWFVRDGVFYAQRFDPARREVTGAPHRIADNITGGLIGAAAATGPSGPIAYRTGTQQTTRQLVWFDRTGHRIAPAGDEGFFVSNPAMSSTGRYVMVQRTVDANLDLWLLDISSGLFTRFTDDPGIESMPVFAPNSSRVVFNRSTGTLESRMTIATLDGRRERQEVEIAKLAGPKIPTDWSHDGRFILFKHLGGTAGSTDVWALPLEGDTPPLSVATTAHEERDAQFSPDSAWVAYESDETSASEIYIQQFPGPGARQRVSTNGGTQVRWRGDGKELYYVASDQSLMGVGIDLTGAAPRISKPVALFKTQIAPVRTISRQQYVVSADGQQFLIATSDAPNSDPITILLNWQPPPR